MNQKSSDHIDVLYHYCSCQTFNAIVSNGKIRLSALNLSNDTMEGRMIGKIMRDHCAVDTSLSSNDREELLHHIHRFQEIFCGLGFCLSGIGDLLSQWRGYADNGRGLSIGFSRESIRQLETKYPNDSIFGLRLNKVSYSDEEHKRQLQMHYQELRTLVTSDEYRKKQSRITIAELMSGQFHKLDSHRSSSDIQMPLLEKLMRMYPLLFSLKSDAFKEEDEWRLVSLRFANELNDCIFSPCEGKIVPCVEIDLLDRAVAITDVILDPKHETSKPMIEGMLKKYGFQNVKVETSKASYR